MALVECNGSVIGVEGKEDCTESDHCKETLDDERDIRIDPQKLVDDTGEERTESDDSEPDKQDSKRWRTGAPVRLVSVERDKAPQDEHQSLEYDDYRREIRNHHVDIYVGTTVFQTSDDWNRRAVDKWLSVLV